MARELKSIQTEYATVSVYVCMQLKEMQGHEMDFFTAAIIRQKGCLPISITPYTDYCNFCAPMVFHRY